MMDLIFYLLLLAYGLLIYHLLKRRTKWLPRWRNLATLALAWLAAVGTMILIP